MKLYRIIGKTPQMRDLFLLENGVFRQHKIIRGKIIEVTEDQLSFYTERLAARKQIEIVEIGEVEEPAPVVLEEPAPEPEAEELIVEETPATVIVETESEDAVAPAPKKRRRRKKKAT